MMIITDFLDYLKIICVDSPTPCIYKILYLLQIIAVT